jgi:hypothetical protein
MSCVITGNTVALRMSGTRLFITLSELWESANARTLIDGIPRSISPLAKNFPGLSNLRALVPAIEELGATVKDVNVTSLGEVADLAAQNRGPVPFGVTWWTNQYGIMQPAGRHMMVAFKGLSGVMIADQSGVRTLAEFMAKMAQGGYSLSIEGGYLVEHAAWITNAATIPRALQFGRQVPDLFAPQPQQSQTNPPPPQQARATAAGESAWVANNLVLPIYHLPGPVAFKMDTQLRRELKRPPRKPRGGGKPGQPKVSKPPHWDDPNLESAEPHVRRREMAEKKPDRSVRVSDLRSQARMSQFDFDDGLMVLEYV